MRIAIVGGAGHVGLPFGILLAYQKSEWEVTLYDKNESSVQTINSGQMPFFEKGAEERLQKVVGKNLKATTDVSILENTDVIIVVIGTPIDQHLNPVYSIFHNLLEEISPYFKKDQTIILRSTIYPGSSEKIYRHLQNQQFPVHLAYCPERIAEGKAVEELATLPQIISGFSDKALQTSRELFTALTSEIIELSPIEAELAKLFTNSWRYIQFATANQFYILAQAHGIDFYKIYHAITHNYPRAAGFPRAGYAAGPCLLKDTMQISAFARNHFFLGHAAMLVNEGLPRFVIDQMKKDHENFYHKKVGILGMAFKAESDDSRDSLSYKLKKILNFEVQTVYCTDEYIADPKFLSLEETIEKSDILVVGAPHNKYKEVLPQVKKPIYDVWNIVKK